MVKCKKEKNEFLKDPIKNFARVIISMTSLY